jgi:hypothetical protein
MMNKTELAKVAAAVKFSLRKAMLNTDHLPYNAPERLAARETAYDTAMHIWENVIMFNDRLRKYYPNQGDWLIDCGFDSVSI